MVFRHLVAPFALALVPLVGFLACKSSISDSEDRAGSSSTTASAQPLFTPDEECTRHLGSIQPVYSATHLGGENGSVDLGNGESATISGSDGVFFDWSATIPIDIVIVRGSETWANVFHQNPPATSGTRLGPPKDPDDQDRQLPLTSVKFCWLDRSGAPPVETPASTEPRACTHPYENRGHAYARTDAIIGRVEATDPTRLGRMAPTSNTTTCTSSFPAPVVEAPTTAFHYDAWTFQNTTGADTCVSVSVLTDARAPRAFQVEVFRGSFDPLDPAASYYAHADNCVVCDLSVRLAADAKLVVVLSGAAAGSPEATSGAGYRLSVGGCGPGTPPDPDAGLGTDAEIDAGLPNIPDAAPESGKAW